MFWRTPVSSHFFGDFTSDLLGLFLVEFRHFQKDLRAMAGQIDKQFRAFAAELAFQVGILETLFFHFFSSSITWLACPESNHWSASIPVMRLTNAASASSEAFRTAPA